MNIATSMQHVFPGHFATREHAHSLTNVQKNRMHCNYKKTGSLDQKMIPLFFVMLIVEYFQWIQKYSKCENDTYLIYCTTNYHHSMIEFNQTKLNRGVVLVQDCLQNY